jgi:hypothetical protein
VATILGKITYYSRTFLGGLEETKKTLLKMYGEGSKIQTKNFSATIVPE